MGSIFWFIPLVAIAIILNYLFKKKTNPGAFISRLPDSLRECICIGKLDDFSAEMLLLYIDGFYYQVSVAEPETEHNKGKEAIYYISFLWKEEITTKNEFHVYYATYNRLAFSEKKIANLSLNQLKKELAERKNYLQRMGIAQVDTVILVAH